VSGRLVLTVCRVIAIACYAVALFTPLRFLAVTEFSLFGLLSVVIAVATWRRRRVSAARLTSPSPAFRRFLSRARSRCGDPERHQS
jgi:hypothetical protein